MFPATPTASSDRASYVCGRQYAGMRSPRFRYSGAPSVPFIFCT